MSWFSKIFGDKSIAKTKESSIPFLHELYNFKADDEAYILWFKSEVHQSLNNLIFNAFLHFKMEGKMEEGMHFISDNKVNGIAIDCKKFDFTRQDYIYLITYITEFLKEQGYILNLADIRSEEIMGELKQTIRAYLKPSRKLVKGTKALQLYGNINLELQSIDEATTQFKMVSTMYNDQHFHDAIDFRLLINQIFKNV